MIEKNLYLCTRLERIALMRIVMSNEEKKKRITRIYAINPKMTTRSRRGFLPSLMQEALL